MLAPGWGIGTRGGSPPGVKPVPPLVSPPYATSTACALRRTLRGPQGAAALRPASGQLRRHHAGAPPSPPACALPRPRGAARRAPLRHAAPTRPGHAAAPQQRRSASGHLPRGASASRTPAAATAAPTARRRREAPSVLRRHPGRCEQQVGSPFSLSFYFLNFPI